MYTVYCFDWGGGTYLYVNMSYDGGDIQTFTLIIQEGLVMCKMGQSYHSDIFNTMY